MYHYLSEPGTPNPFDDEYSREHYGKVPKLLVLSREDMRTENTDPQDEIDWGRKMSLQRSRFLRELVDEMEADKRRKQDAQKVPPVSSSFPALIYSGWHGDSLDSMWSLISRFSATEDVTGGHSSRSQPAGTSTDEGSRGSSYGHELPPQTIEQPAPRLAQAPQGPSECPCTNAPNTGMLTAVWQVKAATKSSRKNAQCYSVR